MTRSETVSSPLRSCCHPRAVLMTAILPPHRTPFGRGDLLPTLHPLHLTPPSLLGKDPPCARAIISLLGGTCGGPHCHPVGDLAPDSHLCSLPWTTPLDAEPRPGRRTCSKEGGRPGKRTVSEQMEEQTRQLRLVARRGKGLAILGSVNPWLCTAGNEGHFWKL